MTEQEIVNVLKENKNKGIAFMFMSEEVKDWIQSHRNDNKLMILTEDGDFIDGEIKPSYQIIATDVFALPDDYKMKQESKGGWVEFDITDKGLFFLEYTDRGGSNVSHRFYWHQWSQFLEYCDIDELKYTVFGGWQYEDSKRWYLAPAVKLHDDLWNSYVIEESGDATPATPVKIRFWREA